MQATVDTTLLIQALSEASRFVATKALTPVLTGILLTVVEVVEVAVVQNIVENLSDKKANNSGKTVQPRPSDKANPKADSTTNSHPNSNPTFHLQIRASTGQAIYQTTIPVSNAQPGTVLIPAGVLVSTIKSLEKGSVQLSLLNNEDFLEISQERVNFRVASMAVTDFPQLAAWEDDQTVILPTQAFNQAAERVMVSASRDETKPVLTSLLIELSRPNALVASDGFRLYRHQVDLSVDKPQTWLLPARMIKEILALLKRANQPTLTCSWAGGTAPLLFRLDQTIVQMAQVNGDFPPYRNIIPEVTSFSLTLDRELWQQRLQQVMIMAKELSNIVIFEMDGSELSIRSQVSAKGQSQIKMPVLAQEGVIPRFACNGVYITDFLATLVDEPEIVLQGNDALKPILLGIPNKSDLLYLIMPFKLQD